MPYDFHVHDAIRVEYRVTTDGPSFPRGYARIQQEARSAGGNGVIAAVALARWGARVLLTGNPIGDDEHGRFLQSELKKIETLTFEPEIRPGFDTPYAILLRAGSYDAGALLSPTASPLELPCRPRDPSLARYFFGDKTAFGDGGHTAILEASSQDYRSLLGTLAGVAAVYLQLTGANWPDNLKAAFSDTVTDLYAATFSDLSSVPTLEQIERSLEVKKHEESR